MKEILVAEDPSNRMLSVGQTGPDGVVIYLSHAQLVMLREALKSPAVFQALGFDANEMLKVCLSLRAPKDIPESEWLKEERQHDQQEALERLREESMEQNWRDQGWGR